MIETSFEMDSKDYAVLILVGQPTLNNLLSRNHHETLRQRIVVNYNFTEIENREIEEYIKSQLKLAGMNENMFEENAIKQFDIFLFFFSKPCSFNLLYDIFCLKN